MRIFYVHMIINSWYEKHRIYFHALKKDRNKLLTEKVINNLMTGCTINYWSIFDLRKWKESHFVKNKDTYRAADMYWKTI